MPVNCILTQILLHKCIHTHLIQTNAYIHAYIYTYSHAMRTCSERPQPQVLMATATTTSWCICYSKNEYIHKLGCIWAQRIQIHTYNNTCNAFSQWAATTTSPSFRIIEFHLSYMYITYTCVYVYVLCTGAGDNHYLRVIDFRASCLCLCSFVCMHVCVYIHI